MSYINPTATNSAYPTASPPAGLNQLDNSQTFLQLLVAQLKNQDPSNPANPTSFMTEIAQLTAVQSQTALNAEEQTVAADSMIGRNVTGTAGSSGPLSGTVTGVLLSSSGAPQLQITTAAGQNQDLPLDAVTQVTGSPAPSAAAPSGAATASGSQAGPTAA